MGCVSLRETDEVGNLATDFRRHIYVTLIGH